MCIRDRVNDSEKATYFGHDVDAGLSVGGGIGVYLYRNFRADVTLDYRMDTDVFGQLTTGTAPLNQFTGEIDSLVGLVNVYYDFAKR